MMHIGVEKLARTSLLLETQEYVGFFFLVSIVQFRGGLKLEDITDNTYNKPIPSILSILYVL